jgi:hypothetical protein
MKNKCPFCGSEKLKIETPYIDVFGEKIYTPCCNSQKKNESYIKAHTSRFDGSKPEPEDVIKF